MRRYRALLTAGACAAWLAVSGGSAFGAAVFQGEEIAVGDVIGFGRYEQDDVANNGKETIEWEVLDIDEAEKQALLLAVDCLDCQPFHLDPAEPGSAKAVTWEESSIRAWLNNGYEGGFLGDAFSESDRDKLIRSRVAPDENGHFREADAGSETEDYVFLLSEAEAKTYFSGKEARRAKTSAWALRKQKREDADEDESEDELWIDTSDTTACSFWWLRTPGEDNTFAECVGAEGSIVQTGYLVSQQYFGVRPAVWVRLS